MPEHRRQYVQLFLLLLALPTQYLLTHWYGANNNTLRISNLRELLTSMKQVGSYAEKLFLTICHHFSPISLFHLDFKAKEKLKTTAAVSQLFENGESVAKETFKYRSSHGHFAQSTLMRSPRPRNVRFRVGQVIKHNVYGYRGVIIGWDISCKAPKSWTDALYGSDKTDMNKPHYLILVDVRDRPDGQMTYVVQDKLTTFTNLNIFHPNLWDFFELYDGAQFHMRPAIYRMYPHD